jgi:PAS domain S-box-containing protein
MKKLSRKLLIVLAAYFVIIAGIQYWHGDILSRRWRDRDLKKTGRLLVDQIQRRENDLWNEKKRIGEQTASLFARLLVQSPDGTGAAAQPPTGTGAAAQPLQPSHYQIGEGDASLGIFTPGMTEMPVQARAIATAYPQLKYYVASLAPFVLDTYFISKDNWLAVAPGRKALEVPESHDALRDPLYADCTPERNPRKEVRFTGPRLDSIWGQWVISLTLPVYLDGAFQGVIGHDIPVEQLFAAVHDEPAAASSCLFILDDSFRVIFHRDLIPLFQKRDFDPGRLYEFKSAINDKKTRQVIAAMEKERAFPLEKEMRIDGGQELVLTSRQPSTGWHYVLVLDAKETSAGARAGEWLFPLLNGLFLLAFTALLFLFLKSTFVSPLTRVHDSLLLFQRTGSVRVPRDRTLFFREIDKVFTNLEKVYSQLHEKIGETNRTKEYLEKLMLTSQSMVVSLDARLRPTFVNEYGLQRFQVERETMARLRIGDFFERKFIREIASELRKNEYVVGKETTMTLRTGEKIDIALSLSKIRDLDDKLSGYLAVIVDISKRKKAEIDLRNQILFSRQIFQSIPEMIIIVDRRLRVTFINKRARDLIQTGGGSIIGQNLNFILAKSSIESGFDELVHNVLEGGNSVHRINTLSPVLEEENYVDLIVEPLKSGNLIIGGIIMLRDISEWRSLTAQLRSLQGFLQKLINASPYAVISINDHNLIITWNSAAEKILGIPFASAFGKNLYALLPLFDKYKDIINEIMILKKTIYLNDEQVFIGEEDFKIANLTLYPVTAEQSGVVIHIEDVSALKKLESSLLQAQKMESLGLLTSHIIHDFNNLLSGIMGYASLLEKKIADNPKVQKYVSTIISSSERASTLINQLLNFSRKKMAEKEIININDLIKESLDFLAMNLKVINLDIQLYRNQILLQADKTKISQILINLIINARDALENAPQPIIRIRTDLVDINNQDNLLDGQYALIEISDNGSGISPENQRKIFEPFFTTKGQGRGTGLGLAIVREIIHDYNGQIQLESEIGRGTMFKILLPVFEEGTYQSTTQELKEATEPLEGLVLLIDDEEVVRDIGADMLKTLGLKCLTAANGTEGIEIFKKNRDEIKLVILDIEMPGISGEKVFHILRELRPEIKILIASGYGREYLEMEIFKGKISHFIPKPFKIEQLSYQVNKLIAGGDV